MHKHKFSQCLRRLHLDFHNPAGIPDLGNDFDGKEFAGIIKGAGFDSVTVFAQDSHGHCYFPTQAGVRHPNLKFDMLGEMVKCCHAEGLTVGPYISVGCSDYAEKDWQQVDAKGRPRSFEEQGGYSMVCLNSPYVTRTILPVTTEVVTKYPVDAICYDLLFFWDEGCHCHWCLQRMKQHGLSPESAVDIRMHMRGSIDEFVEKTAECIWKIKPDVEITYNGLSVHERPDGLQKAAYVDVEALATGGWGYFYFPSKARYLRTLGKPVTGMTSAFHVSWGDFGTLKSRTQLEYESYTFIAAGASVVVGDQLLPRGRLEKARYERISEVLHPIRELEPWLKGAVPLAETAILLPPLGQGQFPGKSWASACKVLMETKIQFDTVDKESDWDRYRLLILPDEAYTYPDFKEKLAKYLEKGGAVLATGESIESLPPKIVRRTSNDVSQPAYLKVKPDISDGIPDMPHVVKSGFWTIEAPKAQTLATLTRPYIASGERFYYSSRQFPYAEETDEPVIIQRGNLIYIGASLFNEYWKDGYGVHRQILVNCLKRLLPQPLIKGQLPLPFEVALLEQGKRRICIIVPYFTMRNGEHVEQIIEEFPKISGMMLSVQGSYERVYLAPNGEQLAHSQDDIYTVVGLPVIVGPVVVVFES